MGAVAAFSPRTAHEHPRHGGQSLGLAHARSQHAGDPGRAAVRDLGEPQRSLLPRSIRQAPPAARRLPLGPDDQAVAAAGPAVVRGPPDAGVQRGHHLVDRSEANGAPSDDGATFDGLLPFVDGDVLQWQEPYWERVTTYLRMAAEHGITVMLYPIDGWTIGHSFVPKSIEQCHQYGGKVAQRFRDLPNIMWMSGGDYASASEDPARGSDVDHCIDAMMRGIREAGTGDRSPCSSIPRRSPPRTPSGHGGSTGTSSTPTTRPIRPCSKPTAAAGETGGSRRGQLRGREQPAGDTTDHGRDPSPAGALGADLRGGRRVRRQ